MTKETKKEPVDPKRKKGRMIAYIGPYFPRLKEQAKKADLSLSDHLRMIIAKHFGEKYVPAVPDTTPKTRMTVTADPEVAKALREVSQRTGKTFNEVLRDNLKIAPRKVQGARKKAIKRAA